MSFLSLLVLAQLLLKLKNLKSVWKSIILFIQNNLLSAQHQALTKCKNPECNFIALWATQSSKKK